MSLLIGFLKILRENNKANFNYDVLQEELDKYIRLNNEKIEYVIMKEFKNR